MCFNERTRMNNQKHGNGKAAGSEEVPNSQTAEICWQENIGNLGKHLPKIPRDWRDWLEPWWYHNNLQEWLQRRFHKLLTNKPSSIRIRDIHKKHL